MGGGEAGEREGGRRGRKRRGSSHTGTARNSGENDPKNTTWYLALTDRDKPVSSLV